MRQKPTISTATEQDIRDAFKEKQDKLKVLTCLLCETPFKQKRYWQKFCNNSCRVVYFRMKAAVEEAAWKEAEPKDG